MAWAYGFNSQTHVNFCMFVMSFNLIQVYQTKSETVGTLQRRSEKHNYISTSLFFVTIEKAGEGEPARYNYRLGHQSMLADVIPLAIGEASKGISRDRD